ncbi:hypothetical protein Q5752_002152 [Cryptotrichosporon argae]
MGIRDLMRWIKTKHPSAITDIPQRWASPMIRGKRIAIDATLLTNRFHFANFDGALSEKSALIGWYLMVQDMRAHDCRVVAIWDERGVRDWKAPEARKRLAKRALDLARQAHETRRQARLVRLRDAFTYHATLDPEVRRAIARHWDETRFVVDPAARPASEPNSGATFGTTLTSQPLPTESSPSAMPSAPLADVAPATAAAAAAMGWLASPTSHVSELVHLVQAYRNDNKPYSRKDPIGEIERAIDDTGVSEITGTADDATLPETPQQQSTLDSKLVEAVPSASYTESPSQHRLTVEEGEIIQATLSGESEGERVAPAGIDDLIGRAPDVKRIYDKALNAPTVAVHDECRELLAKMGVPVLEAAIPYEAEGLAAALAIAGVVDYVGTEDSDVVAYNAPLLRNLSSARSPLQLVESAKLQQLAHMPPVAFRDFCILLGTDASLRIPQVGPARAEALIAKWGSIECILQNEPALRARVDALGHADWIELVGNARQVFGTLPPVPPVNLEMGAFDQAHVEKWLDCVHGLQMVETEDEASQWFEDPARLATRPPAVWDEHDARI